MVAELVGADFQSSQDSFETSGATNRRTQRHIPEEPNSVYVLVHSSLNFTKKGLEI